MVEGRWTSARTALVAGCLRCSRRWTACALAHASGRGRCARSRGTGEACLQTGRSASRLDNGRLSHYNAVRQR